MWAKNGGGGLGKEWGSGQRIWGGLGKELGGGSWQRMKGASAKNGGVWAKNRGSGQRVNGVGRALHVVGRRLQGVRRRRGAVEDVARLAEAVWGEGGAAAGRGGCRAGRFGPGGWYGRDVREAWERRDCCKRFGVKNARGEILKARNEGVWAKNWGGQGKECILWSKGEFSWAKKNIS